MTFCLDALLTLGSLRNNDDDGNENGKKAVGLDKQNNNVALDLLQVDLKSILASGASHLGREAAKRATKSREFPRILHRTKDFLESLMLHLHHAHLHISLPSLHGYNVKLPNFTFCRGQEQKTTTFFFFSWTLMQSFRIQLQTNLPFDELNKMEQRDKVWGSANSLFKWRFRSRPRVRCVNSLLLGEK